MVLLKNGPTPASYCLFCLFSSNIVQKKIADFSRIRIRIVGVEDKHTVHKTTTYSLDTCKAFFIHNYTTCKVSLMVSV